MPLPSKYINPKLCCAQRLPLLGGKVEKVKGFSRTARDRQYPAHMPSLDCFEPVPCLGPRLGRINLPPERSRVVPYRIDTYKRGCTVLLAVSALLHC